MEPQVVFSPLSIVKSRHFVRPINKRYVEQLAAKISEVGLKVYPLSVTTDGVLYGGQHRFEAFTKLGLNECWVHIANPASMDREAIELNRASEDALPMNFVDHAELIWRKLSEKQTEPEIAREIGRGEDWVSNHAKLRKVDASAWQIIGTAFRGDASGQQDVVVPTNGTTVPFTEGLLRVILPRKWDAIGRKADDAVSLSSAVQVELVGWLAKGKDDTGKEFTKKKFSDMADAYHAQAAVAVWFLRQIGAVDDEEDQKIIDAALEKIDSGQYNAEWMATKGPGVKLEKLVTMVRDELAKRHSVVLKLGDAMTVIREHVGDGSIAAVITDPPYNISTDRIYKLASQPDWNKNFGEWDNKSEAEFVGNLSSWAKEFFRVLKPGGSGFMFVGEKFINIAQAIFDAAGFDIRSTFIWCRTNPGTSVTKADMMPASDFAIQFSKPGATRTFNYPGDEGGEGFCWHRFAICSGNERLTDKKGNTLHPTQKPESVIAHLMEMVTVAGDTVLDPFMGVGTMPAVARKRSRRAFGVELDAVYFAAAEQRLANINVR